MNGAHDMGGTHGFGPVTPEPHEPWFHAEWERRAFALTLAMGATGQWNLDMSRSARESRSPDAYLSMSYYALWIAGLERLMRERDLVFDDEIACGRSLHPPKPLARVLAAREVERVLRAGAPTERPPSAAARFAPGERVRAKTMNPPSHTRLPRYVRGHAAIVERVHGCHVYPDAHARGDGEQPQWLYTVVFSGREVWGADADSTLSVSVDAWEPYLDPA